MEISSSIPASLAQISMDRPNRETMALKGDAAKLKESCRQFEAFLWRSVLEKATAPSLGPEAGDKTGTYQYFYTNSMANSVTGMPNSLSSLLYNQLSQQLETRPQGK